MSRIETRVGRMGASAAGSGGIPLLLLHGVGSDRSSWDGQLESFASERQVIALDWPGYGESELQAGADRRDFADAALAALDALGVARAHVCGLSLGGVIGLGMAAIAPERLASLTLANTFAIHQEGAAIHTRSVAAARELGMAGLAEARVDSLLAQPADASLRQAVATVMSRIDPAAYELAAAAVWLADERAAARNWTGPTLIIAGSEDRITPPALSEQLKDLMPHAALVEIAGAGHLSNLEKPIVFDRVLRSFLAGAEQQEA